MTFSQSKSYPALPTSRQSFSGIFLELLLQQHIIQSAFNCVTRIRLQCRRPGFHPWVGKIPWRREWLTTPEFLPGEFHGQRAIQSMGSQGVRHGWANMHALCSCKRDKDNSVILFTLQSSFLWNQAEPRLPLNTRLWLASSTLSWLLYFIIGFIRDTPSLNTCTGILALGSVSWEADLRECGKSCQCS